MHAVVASEAERAQISATEVVASLVRDIRFDPKRLFDEKGRRKKLHEMDEDTLLAVRVEEDKDGYLKIKSPDKAAAREQLMKHLGLFERDNVQKPLVGVNVVHQPCFRSVEFDPIPLTRKG